VLEQVRLQGESDWPHHVATESSFDRAIRAAKAAAESRGLGLLDTQRRRAV